MTRNKLSLCPEVLLPMSHLEEAHVSLTAEPALLSLLRPSIQRPATVGTWVDAYPVLCRRLVPEVLAPIFRVGQPVRQHPQLGPGDSASKAHLERLANAARVFLAVAEKSIPAIRGSAALNTPSSKRESVLALLDNRVLVICLPMEPSTK